MLQPFPFYQLSEPQLSLEVSNFLLVFELLPSSFAQYHSQVFALFKLATWVFYVKKKIQTRSHPKLIESCVAAAFSPRNCNRFLQGFQLLNGFSSLQWD